MDIDVYLGLVSEKYCKSVSLAMPQDCLLEDMVNADTRRSINAIDDDTECEYIPVDTPLIICPSNTTIQPEYPFDVNGPVAIGNVLAGFYKTAGNTTPPTAASIDADISANPANYPTDIPYVETSTPISITNGEQGYHVFRLNQAVLTTILDGASVNVMDAFNVLTDGTYAYYVMKNAVAATGKDYILKS